MSFLKQASGTLAGVLIGLFVGTMISSRAKQAPTLRPAPAVIRAQSFELVSKRGRVLASLGLDEAGNPSFQMYNEKGDAQVRLGVAHTRFEGTLENLRLASDGGPSLWLSNGGENIAISVPDSLGSQIYLKGNKSGIFLLDTKQNAISSYEAGQIRLINKDRERRLTASGDDQTVSPPEH